MRLLCHLLLQLPAVPMQLLGTLKVPQNLKSQILVECFYATQLDYHDHEAWSSMDGVIKSQFHNKSASTSLGIERNDFTNP